MGSRGQRDAYDAQLRAELERRKDDETALVAALEEARGERDTALLLRHNYCVRLEAAEKRDLEALQKALGDWAAGVFPEATELSVLAHLRDEVNTELIPGCELDELADVGILLCQLATQRGASLFDLMEAKHAINLKRKWGPKNAAGFWEHVDD
jgi:hypothetical protein